MRYGHVDGLDEIRWRDLPLMRKADQGARMNAPQGRVDRVRAYLEFIVAVVYFFMARALARHGAHGLVSEQWSPLG